MVLAARKERATASVRRKKIQGRPLRLGERRRTGSRRKEEMVDGDWYDRKTERREAA